MNEYSQIGYSHDVFVRDQTRNILIGYNAEIFENDPLTSFKPSQSPYRRFKEEIADVKNPYIYNRDLILKKAKEASISTLTLKEETLDDFIKQFKES